MKRTTLPALPALLAAACLAWSGTATRAEDIDLFAARNPSSASAPNLLIVPPQLEHVGRQILQAENIVNTAGATPAAGASDLVAQVQAGQYTTACKPGMTGEGIRGSFTVQ